MLALLGRLRHWRCRCWPGDRLLDDTWHAVATEAAVAAVFTNDRLMIAFACTTRGRLVGITARRSCSHLHFAWSAVPAWSGCLGCWHILHPHPYIWNIGALGPSQEIDVEGRVGSVSRELVQAIEHPSLFLGKEVICGCDMVVLVKLQAPHCIITREAKRVKIAKHIFFQAVLPWN